MAVHSIYRRKRRLVCGRQLIISGSGNVKLRLFATVVAAAAMISASAFADNVSFIDNGGTGKTVYVSSANPLPTTGGGGGGGNTPYAPADGSGTITTGGTFQQVFAQNLTRVGCFIQNPTSATEPLFIHWTTASPTTNNSASLGPGSSFSCGGNNTVVTGAIQVTATTTAHAFIATGS